MAVAGGYYVLGRKLQPDRVLASLRPVAPCSTLMGPAPGCQPVLSPSASTPTPGEGRAKGRRRGLFLVTNPLSPPPHLRVHSEQTELHLCKDLTVPPGGAAVEVYRGVIKTPSDRPLRSQSSEVRAPLSLRRPAGARNRPVAGISHPPFPLIGTSQGDQHLLFPFSEWLGSHLLQYLKSISTVCALSHQSRNHLFLGCGS